MTTSIIERVRRPSVTASSATCCLARDSSKRACDADAVLLVAADSNDPAEELCVDVDVELLRPLLAGGRPVTASISSPSYKTRFLVRDCLTRGLEGGWRTSTLVEWCWRIGIGLGVVAYDFFWIEGGLVPTEEDRRLLRRHIADPGELCALVGEL